MDRELWTIVMAAVHRAARAVGKTGRRPVYANWLIVAMYLWSVMHDRCLSWACDRLHYNTLFRPRRLPSISQFTRRVKSESCQAILQRVHQDLASRGVVLSLSYLDGKPLPVSAVSKDPDAKIGHITGGFAKGYKLHAFVTENRRILIWSVMPLNADEKQVAQALLAYLPLPPEASQELTLADSNYDAAPLYKSFAAQSRTLLAPVRGKQFVGPKGRGGRKLKEMGPQRRAALSIWDTQPLLTRYVMEQRNNIEGVFSVMSVACGLYALPPSVRRLHRVRRWVGAKIILYHARLIAQENAATKAVA